MLTRFLLPRLLLLVGAVFSLTCVPDCWGGSDPAARYDEQLPDLLLETSVWDRDGFRFPDSGETTLTASYGLEQSLHGRYFSDRERREIPFASAKFLIKRYCRKIGIPDYVTEGFAGLRHVKWKLRNVDDALAGGLIGMASNYVFAEPYMGWHIKAEGGLNNVTLSFRHAW